MNGMNQGAPAGVPVGPYVPPTDNTAGNSGQQGTGGESTNNAGQEAALDAFWSQQPTPPEGTQGNQGETNQPPAPNPLVQQIGQQLQGLSFKPVMTEDVVQEINAGNFDGFNKALSTQLQEAARQTLGLSVQVMKAMQETILAQIDKRLEGQLNHRDNLAFLGEHIPSAKDPKTRPMVEQVYTQALRLANGDKAKAIETTKAMWKTMAQLAGQDFGLNLAPINPSDAGPPGQLVNLQSLLEVK